MRPSGPVERMTRPGTTGPADALGELFTGPGRIALWDADRAARARAATRAVRKAWLEPPVAMVDPAVAA